MPFGGFIGELGVSERVQGTECDGTKGLRGADFDKVRFQQRLVLYLVGYTAFCFCGQTDTGGIYMISVPVCVLLLWWFVLYSCRKPYLLIRINGCLEQARVEIYHRRDAKEEFMQISLQNCSVLVCMIYCFFATV